VKKVKVKKNISVNQAGSYANKLSTFFTNKQGELEADREGVGVGGGGGRENAAIETTVQE
jgi:hypothetical protein